MSQVTNFLCYIETQKLDACAQEQLNILKDKSTFPEKKEAKNFYFQLKESFRHMLQICKEADAKGELYKGNGIVPESNGYLILTADILGAQKLSLFGQMTPFFKDIAETVAAVKKLETCYQAIAQKVTNTSNLSVERLQAPESEDHYKDLFENAHDLIHMVAPDGKIIYVNHAWLSALGYPIEELQEASIYSFVDEKDVHWFRSYREEVVAGTNQLDAITVTFLSKEKKQVIVEGFISAKYKNDQPLYTQGIFRDITVKVANERQLKLYNEQIIEREENLQQLIRNAPDAVIVINTESNITLWNPKAEALFGWRSDEVTGKPLTDTIIPPAYRPAHAASMKRYLSTGQVHILNKTIEVTALHKKGHEFPISLTISQTRQAGKVMFISFIRDITLQKQNEQELENKRRELENKNKELEQYAWLTSHDLREPLRKILTYSDLLLTGSYDLSADARASLLKIHDSAKRMGNLIQAILMYSSITEDEIIYTNTDLNSVVHEVLNDLEVSIHENEAVLHLSPLPTIEAVPFQMQQVFQNLISNAIKYSKPEVKPVITIYSKPADANTVEIVVEDNGIGFDMKDEQKAFQLFQRLHSGDKKEGTGIGLAICRKIIQNHGGNIRAQSEIGEGSAFIIMLPVKQ